MTSGAANYEKDVMETAFYSLHGYPDSKVHELVKKKNTCHKLTLRHIQSLTLTLNKQNKNISRNIYNFKPLYAE